MAKKKKKGNAKRSKVATLSSHALFNEADALLELAEDTLRRLDGTRQEKNSVKKYVGVLRKVHGPIADLCGIIEGGNPMFHDFKVKPIKPRG